jgi:hypothetical protein
MSGGPNTIPNQNNAFPRNVPAIEIQEKKHWEKRMKLHLLILLQS